MKKLIISASVLSVIACGAFILGYAYSENSVRVTELKYDRLNILNTLASYRGHVGISSKIKESKYEYAKCMADLRASVEFNELRKCLGDPYCGVALRKELGAGDSDLISGKVLNFRYYKYDEPCSGGG